MSDMAVRDLPMDAALCYVDGAWAWFTTKALGEQWGDDWNDAPYEHNAEPPYGPCWHREGGKACACPSCERDWNEDGTPKWEVVRVAWDGPFETPDAWHLNSPWSVEQINAGAVAWLAPERHGRTHGVHIFAGTTLHDFVRRVTDAGGVVYLPAREDT